MAKAWERQIVRAGPLVKELRMIRPRASPLDTPEDRREKEWIKKYCSLNRDATDRLELRLALFGWEGMHYRLSFDADHLPDSYAGVQREMENFLLRCKRRRAREGLPPGFDYVRCIEGIHGDHRYHVHYVVRDSDFSEEAVAALWRRGDVHREPVLKDATGYRRLARYFRKERQDGERLPLDVRPLSWSGSLRVPEVRCSIVKTGRLRAPKEAIVLQQPSGYASSFGSFAYLKYLIPDSSRACACARTILQ